MHSTEHETWIDARRFENYYSLSRRTFFAWIADGRLVAYRPWELGDVVVLVAFRYFPGPCHGDPA
jgi:hypothetical protein